MRTATGNNLKSLVEWFKKESNLHEWYFDIFTPWGSVRVTENEKKNKLKF